LPFPPFAGLNEQPPLEYLRDAGRRGQRRIRISAMNQLSVFSIPAPIHFSAGQLIAMR
jgi:hypothetical protein